MKQEEALYPMEVPCEKEKEMYGRMLECDGSSGDAELERRIAGIMQEAFNIFKQRQRKYGKKNISQFGSTGVVVRSYDKLARLGRFYVEGEKDQFGDEAISDTWLDALNYAAIGLCCERKEWD